jgi:hypothetical protein
MQETDRERRTAGDDPGAARERRRWPPHLAEEAEDRPATSSLRNLLDDLRKIREFGAYYLSAKKDRLQLGVRQALIWGAVGFLGVCVLLTLLVTAVVLLLVGLSRGLGEAFGEASWLGPTVLGGGIVLLLASAVAIGLWWLRSSYRKKTVEKYEKLEAHQRATLGEDITGSGEDRIRG